MPRSSIRRKSTTSLLFQSSTKPNQSKKQRKASTYAQQRAEVAEQVRQKELQKSRDQALMALYDEAALKSIDVSKWLKGDAGTQRLKLMQEIRSVKFIVTKIRRDQLREQKKETEDTPEICGLMKRHLTKYVADVFFGAEHVDVRSTMALFPMEIWGVLKDALYDHYFNLDNPISQKWSLVTSEAEDELRKIIKKIKMAIYKAYDGIVIGSKGKTGCLEVAHAVAKQMRKDIIAEGSEEISEISIFTQFQATLIDKLKADITIIEISSSYGNTDCSKAIQCLGQILENYLIFKKAGSWKQICQRMINKIKAIYAAQRQIERSMNDPILPLTQYEYQGGFQDICVNDNQQTQRAVVSSVVEHPPILVSDDEHEEMSFENREQKTRVYASQRSQNQGEIELPTKRKKLTEMPNPKRRKMEETEPLFSDSEPPCSPEPSSPPMLEGLTQ